MSVVNFSEAQLKEFLEGQTFRFRLSMYDCITIDKIPVYNKYSITCKGIGKTPRTLVLLKSELDEIKIMSSIEKNEKVEAKIRADKRIKEHNASLLQLKEQDKFPPLKVPIMKQKQIRKNSVIFTPSQDKRILEDAEYGSSKRLALEFGKTESQIYIRRAFLIKNSPKPVSYSEPAVEEIFKIGDTVKGIYNDEGVIVNIKNEPLRAPLYVVQIVNAVSKFAVRGDMKHSCNERLIKIPKICPL